LSDASQSASDQDNFSLHEDILTSFAGQWNRFRSGRTARRIWVARNPGKSGNWHKQRPEVTLFDLRMPVLDGVGVINEVRQEETFAKFLILTTYDSDNDIYRAIKAGAKGYLLKDARREVLLDSIRKVARGETCIPPALVEKLASGVSCFLFGFVSCLAKAKSLVRAVLSLTGFSFSASSCGLTRFV
jgi:CheY-like chemotaxis protein